MKTLLRHLPASLVLATLVTLPAAAQRPVPPHLMPNTDDPITPRTKIEAFEAATSRMVIKGTEELGFVNGRNGTIYVKCIELRDPASNQRQLGVLITVRQTDGTEDTSTVDHDELDNLYKAVDYVSKVDTTSSSLSQFEAGYTTPGGFRVVTYVSRRTTNKEAVAVSGRYNRTRTSLDLTQLAELKLVLEQAQTKLDNLAKTK